MMPEEIRFFIRTAAFGLAIGAIYWFVSYEPAGTLMLAGFGVAGAFLATVFARSLRQHGWRPQGRPWSWLGVGSGETPPLGAEPTRYPSPGCAPLACGLGLSIAALTAVYGIPLLLIALPILLFGAWAWLRAAVAEYEAQVESDASPDQTT